MQLKVPLIFSELTSDVICVLKQFTVDAFCQLQVYNVGSSEPGLLN